MSEADAVERSKRRPITVASLVYDLRALGVEAGMTLLAHSSLSALGWVAGGPQAVVLALEEVLTPAGTLMMPTFSGGLTDPAGWQNPPVPEAWWEGIRAETPAFDPAMTPTRGMGAIVECFRRQPGVRRSNHPHLSFAAWGRHAVSLTADSPLEACLGEGSPLARLYDLDGWVLLLGVGHGNNSSLHLAEHRAAFPGKRIVSEGAPFLVDGERQWVSFQALDYYDDDFPQIGEAFAAGGEVRSGPAGEGTAQLMRERSLVAFGVQWIEQHRQQGGSHDR